MPNLTPTFLSLQDRIQFASTWEQQELLRMDIEENEDFGEIDYEQAEALRKELAQHIRAQFHSLMNQ